jgi:hypothetical protein
LSAAAVLAAMGPVRIVAPVAPRVYRGDMGIFLDDVPDVGAGGDPRLVLSFMYPRYQADFRATIRAAWQARQSLDVLLSNQDDAAYGLTLAAIVAARQELCAAGFRPCEWLASKVYSPRDDAAGTLAIMEPTLAAFLAADCISRYCVGGELDLWNTYASLQAMTDAIAPRVNAIGRTLAVHFSTDRADWRPDHPGSTFADYWNPNQGKLSGGLWFQSYVYDSDANLQAEMVPILQRFAGNFGVVADCGFGHPFDVHAVEHSLEAMYDGDMDQAEADRRGSVLLATPAQGGPAGMVSVMGSGNGQHRDSRMTGSPLTEAVTDEARLTVADIDQIIEGIEHFIMNGDPEVDQIWQPYIDKLKVLRSDVTNASRKGQQ